VNAVLLSAMIDATGRQGSWRPRTCSQELQVGPTPVVLQVWPDGGFPCSIPMSDGAQCITALPKHCPVLSSTSFFLFFWVRCFPPGPGDSRTRTWWPTPP